MATHSSTLAWRIPWMENPGRLQSMGSTELLHTHWFCRTSMLSFKPAFSLSSFTFIKRFLFTFCHKGAVICISQVIDISPSDLDSSLCFIQPSISHDVLHIEVKWAGWQYTALTYSFPNLEPLFCSMSGFNCCFLTTYRLLRMQARCSGIPISWRIFHSCCEPHNERL